MSDKPNNPLEPPIQRPQVPPPRRNDLQVFGDSVVDAMALNWPGQLIQRMRTEWDTQQYIDVDYNVFAEEDFSQFPMEHWDLFADVQSPEEFRARTKDYWSNVERRMRQQDASSMLGSFIGYAADPVNLIPIPALGAGNVLRQAGRGALLFTGVNAMGEFARVGLDPTAEPEELYTTLGFSAVLGGLIGGSMARLKRTPSWYDQRYLRHIVARHKAMFHADESAMQVARAGTPDVELRLTRELHAVERDILRMRALPVEGVELTKPFLELQQKADAIKEMIADVRSSNPSLRPDQITPGYKRTPLSPDPEGNIPMTVAEETAEGPLRQELTDQVRRFREGAGKLDQEAERLSQEISEREGKIANAKNDTWAQRYREGNYGSGHKSLAELEGELNGMNSRRLDLDLRADKMEFNLNGGADALRFAGTGTGLESLMGMTKQFPFHRTIQNKLPDVGLPTFGKSWQIMAMEWAGSPGLAMRVSQEGVSPGPSIEMVSKQYWNGFFDARKEMMNQYYKMLGLGESAPSTFQVAARDTRQRILALGQRARARILRRPQDRPVAYDIDTIAGFDQAVGRAMLGLEPENAHVAAAAKYWQDNFFRPLTKQMDELGMLPGKQSMLWHIDKLKTKLDATEVTDVGKQIEIKAQIADLEDRIENLTFNEANANYPFGYMPRIYMRYALDDPATEEWLRELIRKHIRGKSQVWMGDRMIKITPTEISLEAAVEEIVANLRREITYGDGIGTMRGMDGGEAMRLRRQEIQQKINNNFYADDKKGRAVAEARIQNLSEYIIRYQKRMKDLDNVRAGVLAKYKTGDLTLSDSLIGGGNAPPGFVLSRSLNFIPSSELAPILETSMERVAGHYISRMAPLIETTRRFGDMRGQIALDHLIAQTQAAIRKMPAAQRGAATAELEVLIDNVTKMRDIVQGNFGIPDDPSAWSHNVTRAALGWSAMTWMGRSAQSAMIDAGLMGTTAGFRPLFRNFLSYFEKDDFLKLARQEGEAAGLIGEIVMSSRLQQVSEAGSWKPGMMRATDAINSATGRFFFVNGLAPWTDMAKSVASGLAQHEMIRVVLDWDNISAVKKAQFAKVGLNNRLAKEFAKQWKLAGSNQTMRRGQVVYWANTGAWQNDAAVRAFRGIMAGEVNNVVITPGAASKPTMFISSDLGRIIGQFRGFGMDATQKVLMAGLQRKDKVVVQSMGAMIALGMLVDWWRRPDFIDLSIDEALLRGIELSGVLGVGTDFNMIAEQLSGDTWGVRPMFGMKPVIKAEDNWARQIGVVAGAAPQSWLNLIWAYTDPDAGITERARAIRFIFPYQNHLLLQETNREIERALVRGIQYVNEEVQ